MRLGIALPTSGSTANTDAIATVAETAERIGLDSVWSFERLLSPTAGAEMNGKQVQAFRTAATAAGHDPAVLPVVVRINQFPAAEPDTDGASPTGSSEQIFEAIPRLEALGVTELLWNFDGPVDEQLPRLAQLAELAGTAA